MRRKRRWVWTGVALGLLLLVWLGASRFSLSAVGDPGRVETWLAWKAKRWLVGRSAKGVSTGPAWSEQQAAFGQMQFRALCADCHGTEGREPTEIGRAMYPRATDLGAAEVQAYSDAELFWIIRNGLRLTGMPGFHNQLSDEEIWPLVHYVRSLGEAEKP